MTKTPVDHPWRSFKGVLLNTKTPGEKAADQLRAEGAATKRGNTSRRKPTGRE